MWPDVASASRLIMRSSVDFPAPERPMIPTICPVGTSNVTLSTAVSDPNVFVNRSIFSIKPSGLGPGLKLDHHQPRQNRRNACGDRRSGSNLFLYGAPGWARRLLHWGRCWGKCGTAVKANGSAVLSPHLIFK